MKYNASFTERFFSLRRVNHKNQLTNMEILKCLVQICLLPHITVKLDELYEKILFRIGQDNSLADGQLSKSELFVQLYPFVKRLFQFINLLYSLSYSVNITRSPNLIHHILFGNNILMEFDTNSSSSNDTNRFVNYFTKIFDFSLKSATFAIHLMDYWNTNSEVRSLLSFNSSIQIPPPKPLKEVSYPEGKNILQIKFFFSDYNFTRPLSTLFTNSFQSNSTLIIRVSFVLI